MIRNAFWFLAGAITMLIVAILDAVMPVRLRRKADPDEPGGGWEWFLLALAVAGCCLPLRSSGAPTLSTAAPQPSPTTEIGTAIVGGVASWYAYNPGEAAAGKMLRQLLGKDWRGSLVKVRYREAVVWVRLTDAMSHPTRLIDLDRRSFAALADPSKGLLEVQITLR